MKITPNQFGNILKAAKQAVITEVLTIDEYTNIADFVCEIVDEMYRTEPKNVCEWSYDDDSYVYKTECGELQILINGTPADNKYVYCPYCGKRITEIEE